jgi:Fe-S-cluster containining protein
MDDRVSIRLLHTPGGNMNRAERKRQAKEDEKRLRHGIDPELKDPAPTAAMARQLFALFEEAKREGSVEAAMKFLYAKVTATLAAQPIAVACARGCSFCCNGWVSATAPEILFVGRRVRAGGEALAARVAQAQAATEAFTLAERPNHPHPCPILEDHACSLYESRPFVCRLAASMDAKACERVIRLLAPETIPSPLRNLKTRELYEIAMTTALLRAGLPHRYYDLTGGLGRVLAREDAEAAWLAGEDIFDGVAMDPTDVMTKGNAQLVYRSAFG